MRKAHNFPARYRRPMRVVFCWQMMSGYMAACWRALAAREGIEVHVIARRPESGSAVEFASSIMDGIDSTLLTQAEMDDPEHLTRLVRDQKPDVVVLCGWGSPSYPTVAEDPALARCKFVMTMDTPYSGTLRQRLGGVAKRRYFKRFDHCVVAGERTHRLARALGFDASILTRGVYSVDGKAFETAIDQRAQLDQWPDAFLYVGRYAPVKGIDVLAGGYRRYREQCEADGLTPWRLETCGKGDESRHFAGLEGHTDHGFTQPDDLPGIMATCGAFVITSEYEPWGTVLAEAGFAGLPIICTEACSAHLDVVRTYYNGVVTPTGDLRAMASAMRWIHDRRDIAAELGRRSRALADPYSGEAWADRWQGVLSQVCGG